MGATTGLTPIGTYSGLTTNAARIAVLLSLIPNPDSTSSSGAQAAPGLNQGNNNSFLDEMSPAAAAQLRVEIAACAASLVEET